MGRDARRYRQSGSDRLEKQPTGLRRKTCYFGDRTLVALLNKPKKRYGALKLVADLSQQSFAPGDILFLFQSLWRRAIDNPKNCPTLFCCRDDHFYGIGCGAIDTTNLSHVFERVQDIDWIKALAKKNEKTVAGGDRFCIFLREFDHDRIGATPADQTFTGSLAECQAELNPWDSGNECFMNVLDRLDEMRLSKNEVDRIRLFDFYGDQFHLLRVVFRNL
jgi:hypothetical protein